MTMILLAALVLPVRTAGIDENLDVPWGLRKGSEQELWLAMGLSTKLFDELNNVVPRQGETIRERRLVYNRAGSLLRLGDALQECILAAADSKQVCSRCSATKAR